MPVIVIANSDVAEVREPPKYIMPRPVQQIDKNYNDEIYIADTYNHSTIRLSLTGKCIAKESTLYNYPHAIAAHKAFVYVGYTSWSGHGRYISAIHRHKLNASNTIDTGYSNGFNARI